MCEKKQVIVVNDETGNAMLYKYVGKPIDPDIQKVIDRKVEEARATSTEEVKLFSVRVPMSLYSMLRAKSALREQSLQDAVREAIEWWLVNNG